ncbi:polyprenyl synthetase family protein, partial [Streptomyces mirabilis]|uniref:polyprenyl synthetase family protein n=1 Tax=Streptomyces mirabilis TaxID=68239 RepID=UPI00368C58DB
MSEREEHAFLKKRIDQVLSEFVAAEAQALADIDACLAPVAEQLYAATGHGKRLRAAFCYWGWRGAGQPDSEALVRAAGAIELVHAAAVVHDDLIDHSRTRHGRPCAVQTLIAAGQAAYLYSLMTPPSTRVRRSRCAVKSV